MTNKYKFNILVILTVFQIFPLLNLSRSIIKISQSISSAQLSLLSSYNCSQLISLISFQGVSPMLIFLSLTFSILIIFLVFPHLCCTIFILFFPSSVLCLYPLLAYNFQFNLLTQYFSVD